MSRYFLMTAILVAMVTASPGGELWGLQGCDTGTVSSVRARGLGIFQGLRTRRRQPVVSRSVQRERFRDVDPDSVPPDAEASIDEYPDGQRNPARQRVLVRRSREVEIQRPEIAPMLRRARNNDRARGNARRLFASPQAEREQPKPQPTDAVASTAPSSDFEAKTLLDGRVYVYDSAGKTDLWEQLYPL